MSVATPSLAHPPALSKARLRELKAEVEDFNAAYCAVLDACDVENWPAFFTDDGVYRISARENVAAGRPLDLVYCDGMGMLKDRAAAIMTTEMFAPRYLSHHISNLRITGYEAGVIAAEANYLVLETLIDEPTKILQAGRYVDRFAERGAGLLLQSRQCVYETTYVPNCLVYPV